MTNRSKTLYTGVLEHTFSQIPRRFGDIRAAIAREKQIKGLTRVKKMALIVSMNPEWKDLSETWFVRHQYQAESA
jgi:putative endonuclease